VFAETIDEIPAALSDVVRDRDVVIGMGAGSIGQLPARLGQAGTT
jgi:UDP-N-acetylmuramate--alanine ligase